MGGKAYHYGRGGPKGAVGGAGRAVYARGSKVCWGRPLDAGKRVFVGQAHDFNRHCGELLRSLKQKQRARRAEF